jgi:hypothetical protein
LRSDGHIMPAKQNICHVENCSDICFGSRASLRRVERSGNKRTSRQEMEKVARGKTPVAPTKDWLAMAGAMEGDLDGLRLLYSEAKTANAPKDTLDRIAQIANEPSGAEHSDSKLDRNTGVLE